MLTNDQLVINKKGITNNNVMNDQISNIDNKTNECSPTSCIASNCRFSTCFISLLSTKLLFKLVLIPTCVSINRSFSKVLRKIIWLIFFLNIFRIIMYLSKLGWKYLFQSKNKKISQFFYIYYLHIFFLFLYYQNIY